MRLDKVLKKSLAVALVFGSACTLVGCNNDSDSASKEETNQYEIYKLANEAGYEGTYEEWLASIKGEKGDKGDKGDTGSKGNDGNDGTIWHTGTENPDKKIGVNGDFYYNSETKKIFHKVDNNWLLITIIEDGEKGDKGNNGENGKSVEFQVTSTYVQWRYKTSDDSDEWKNLIELTSLKGSDGLDGIDGANGSRWFYGEEDPVLIESYNDGDFYLNVTSYDVFTKNGASWIKLCNIKGDTGSKGEEGKRGASFIFGTEEPNENTEGIVGDVYFDVSTRKIYLKNKFEKWVLMCSLVGDKGEKGDKGDTGNDGKEVEFQTTDAHIQWRYKTSDDSEEWQNLVELDSLKGEIGDKGNTGADGREIELQTTDTYIQWRYKTSDDSEEWQNLVELDTLKGSNGQDGITLKDVNIVPDKWGINVTYTFIFSDDTSIIKKITNEIDNTSFYSCSSEEDFLDLLELGVTNIKLSQDITVSQYNVKTGSLNRRLAVLDKENMVIDLNGFSITPASGVSLQDILSVQSNNEYDVNVTIKNGALGMKIYDNGTNSNAGITVFGGDGKGNLGKYGKLTLNIENVVSYGSVYALSSNGNWNGATINASDSSFIVSYHHITETSQQLEMYDGVGAYLPANNTNTFVNCMFSGDTGVYIKGGSTTLANSKVYAYGEKKDYVASTNGYNSTGSALVVESSFAYSTPVEVMISGGIYKSENNELIEEIDNVGNAINITGKDSAILDDGNYKIIYNNEIISFSIVGNKIIASEESNVNIEYYSILNDYYTQISFSVNKNDITTSYLENFIILKETNTFIDANLLSDIIGTYNKFYLNDGNISYDSLKLYADGTYKLYLVDGNVKKTGDFYVEGIEDSNYIIKLDDSTSITLFSYVNSFSINN